jgi:hypothetical protein
MSKADKILKLLQKKEKDVHLLINPTLWKLFRQACRKNNVSPNHKISELILKFLEDEGILDEFLNEK